MPGRRTCVITLLRVIQDPGPVRRFSSLAGQFRLWRLLRQQSGVRVGGAIVTPAG